MTTTKVFIGTRFNSDRVKALEKIAKKLHISKNAVLENAFDIYAEDVLGVITLGDNTNDQKVITPTNDIIQKYEDRIAALELKLSKLEATPTAEIKSTQVETAIAPLDVAPSPSINPSETIIELPKTPKATEANEDNIFDNSYTEPTEAIEPTLDIFDDAPVIEQPIEQPDSSQLSLPRVEFEQRFNLDSNGYAQAGSIAKKIGYWTAEDGSKWTPSGTKKDRLWNNYPAAIAEA